MKYEKSEFFAFLVLSFFLAGCNPERPTIEKCWFYIYETEFKTHNKSGLTAASFLCLQKDGSYTRDFGVFDFGSWTYNDNKLNLSSRRNQSISLEMLSLKSDELAAVMDGEKINFDGRPLPSDKSSENPFSLENNLWRIPAAKSENDDAIRQRLRAHCRFWELYFTWGLNMGLPTLDVRSTPTLFKIYGNGVTLKTLDEEPARWKSYFYDDDDSQKAYDILKRIFEKQEIALAHTANKYKMFIGAFQQLELALK